MSRSVRTVTRLSSSLRQIFVSSRPAAVRSIVLINCEDISYVSLLPWSAPHEWSDLIIDAWSVFGLSARGRAQVVPVPDVGNLVQEDYPEISVAEALKSLSST